MTAASPTYWLDLFTWKTWDQFLKSGANISGFTEYRRKTVERFVTGDILLCYLTGISRFIGILEVISGVITDGTPIWGEGQFPVRVKVRPVVTLTPETAVPVLDLQDTLSIFKDLKNPNYWSGAFRGSPAKWRRRDGELVVEAVRNAEASPVVRQVDKKKLAHRPKAIATKLGPVSEPEVDEESEVLEPTIATATTHTEMQWMLLKLGSDMGLDVWVARNDKSKTWEDRPFSSVAHLLDELPIQFDTYTNRVIELIDVLWLQGNSIVGAFEIESTTSIFSGLLRMSDLISMQPNINIPLYLVAPDERRNKVIREVNRPTFAKLKPPLVDVCRYIPFSVLRQQSLAAGPYVRYLKPDFIAELSDSCDLEEP
ncbi:MAG: hypothetical protein H0U53_03295 [Actinobacteria bacterium]|nr:hypothetical protein [Actinomycetota bacterium]